MVLVWAAGAIAVLILALIVMLAGRLQAKDAGASVSPTWLDDFSMARYRPMERLLMEEDFLFLSSEAGYTPEIGRRLRRDRRRIFRRYLRRLICDFNRLHLAARQMVLYAPQDRSDLALVLIQQRVLFAWAIFNVEVRLFLHWLGLGPVDVSGLVRALDSMRIQIRSYSLAGQDVI